MNTIYLVACTQQKNAGLMPAKELYMASQWFRKARAVAETGDDWFIVSARLGLVDPEEMVKEYCAYVGDFHDADKVRYDAQGWGPEGFYVDEWSDIVVEELQHRVAYGSRVVLLGSKAYATPLRPVLEEMGFVVETPLRGLGIGDQKKLLKAMV